VTETAGAVQQEKRVTWAELFFDLVFVVAVTQVSALLHGDHSLAGVGKAAIVFAPIYLAWVGTTIHANTHEVDSPGERIGIFAVGAGGLFMALAVPEAYGERGLLFALSYLAMRVVLAALVWPTHRSIPINSFTAAVFVTGPLLVLGALVDGNARVAVWAVAAVIDLFVPWLARTRLADLPFDMGHLPERFGLFLTIALGESIVAVGLTAADRPTSGPRLAAVLASYVLACGLWWVYFVFAADAIRHALETSAIKTDVIRPVLSYAHRSFIGSIIAIAVGLGEAVAHPTDALPFDLAALLIGGCALYLATFGYTRWRMFHLVSTTRLTAAAVCLALLPLSQVVSALALTTLLAAVLVVLNLVEWGRVRAGSR
jgi:low temperature requirement protein LtrA